MHHALEIQEILAGIFVHCLPIDTGFTSADLPVLARTCRAFKEPALDMLWAELVDLSPVARCLPEASHLTSTEYQDYAFSRPLTQIEWEVLRNYTRRIRAVQDFGLGLDWKSVKNFLNPPTTESLFPNLRYLYCGYLNETLPLLCLPLPSLTSLDFSFMLEEERFEGLLELFPRIAPNVRRLVIDVCPPEATFNSTISRHIFHWRNLQEVFCREVTLDADALVQLSYLPALTRLFFSLSDTASDQINSSNSPLIFSNLHELELHSLSLIPISKLLIQSRLPVIRELAGVIESCPSKQDVSSFFSGIGRTIQELRLVQWSRYSDIHIPEDTKPLLEPKDLQPCTAFNNLRHAKFILDWKMGLTDDEMLALASACPSLRSLTINTKMFNGGPHIVPDT